MNVAIWLLIALLALPVAEIALFVALALNIGFGWAALALVSTSLIGALMLRHGGGGHVERMRVVLGPQRMSALAADSAGTMFLVAAILLLIPGFITDLIGLLLLIAPLRRALGAALRRAAGSPPARSDGVVDLAPQDWHRVADGKLEDARKGEPRAPPH
jgi:UPF0716 protein FxsA